MYGVWSTPYTGRQHQLIHVRSTATIGASTFQISDSSITFQLAFAPFAAHQLLLLAAAVVLLLSTVVVLSSTATTERWISCMYQILVQ